MHRRIFKHRKGPVIDAVASRVPAALVTGEIAGWFAAPVAYEGRQSWTRSLTYHISHLKALSCAPVSSGPASQGTNITTGMLQLNNKRAGAMIAGLETRLLVMQF